MARTLCHSHESENAVTRNAALDNFSTNAHAREILFVDPGVSDVETILDHLRPEVEAILLHAPRPMAQQIAAALNGRHGLHTVHIIAHGEPGRVGFAAGHLDVDVPMAHPASAWRND